MPAAALAKAPFSIRKMLEVLKEDLPADVANKLIDLRRALQKYRTPLRDDSVLAWNYVNGCLPACFTFQHVVFELLMTRYLHEYTNYKQISYRLCGDHRNFHPLIPRDKEHLRAWLLPLAKFETLHISGLPEQWPWMLEPPEDGEVVAEAVY